MQYWQCWKKSRRSKFLHIFALGLLLSCPLLTSEARADGPIFSLGLAYGEESSADGHSYEGYLPFVVRGGYAFTLQQIPFDTYLEYQQFDESDGSNLLTVSRQHHELSAWARYRISQTWRLKPYVAAGIGADSDWVKTNFNGDSSTASQEPELLLGMATGVSVTLYRGWEAQLEARLTSANSFEPNPLLQLGVHLGYRF